MLKISVKNRVTTWFSKLNFTSQFWRTMKPAAYLFQKIREKCHWGTRFFVSLTIFSTNLFIGFSIDLPNIEMFLNLEFFILFCCLLFLLVFVILYYNQYMLLWMFLVWILILTLNKVLTFLNGVSIFLLARLGKSLWFLTRETLLTSLISSSYSGVNFVYDFYFYKS